MPLGIRTVLHLPVMEYSLETGTGEVPRVLVIFYFLLWVLYKRVCSFYENLISCALMIYAYIFWYTCICSIKSFKMVEFANPSSVSAFLYWIVTVFSVFQVQDDRFYLSCYIDMWMLLGKGNNSPIISVARWSLLIVQATPRKSCNFNMTFFFFQFYG